MRRVRLSNRSRATATAALLSSALAWPTLAGAQSWTNPGTGSWFDPLNWSTAAIPVAGDAVIVSNGGAASLNGLPATPVLGSLNIGLAGTGTGVGTVTSNGVAVNAGAVLNIAISTSAGASANGLLQIDGGVGGTANNVSAGFVASSVPATATGRLNAAGSFVVTGGNLVIGQTFGAARGSVANGVVNIGGNAGTVNFLIVGDVFSFNNDQVGSRAAGMATVVGDMTLTGFASVGTAFSPDRVADATAPGGFRVNRASATLNIGGTLSIANTATSLIIGTTGGGVVDGSMSVSVLDLATGHAVSLAVGNSSTGGQASGTLTAVSGDLQTNLQVDIGTAIAGTAQGSVTLGGRLLGNDSGLLRVGTVLNPSGIVPGASAFQGIGSVSAAGGISGYAGYDIAAVTGPQAAGSRADGSVTGGASAPTSNVTRFVSVGVVNNTGNAASANGTLILGNSLNILNRDFIAGSASSVAGSTATGAASIAGDVGTVRDLLVGQSVAFGADQVGSRATGTVEIGGNMSLTRFLLAGYTSADGFTLLDRVADAAAPGGFRSNQGNGAIKVGGTLSITNTATSLFIGTTSGGIADGSVRVGSMAMAGNTLQHVDVGVSGAQGRATGALEVNGGTLRADSVRLGTTTGGIASGRLAVTNANLEANTVQAGAGGGTAMLLLTDSQASVAQDMTLMAGLLGLERSRLRVGNNFTFGNDALLHVEIDGLTRGTQYGSIDALAAALDGRIEFDFGNLLFSGATAVFDILRSGGTNGITGDFDSFSFLNFSPTYTATAGIELDAGVEVYRVRLARINAVPEPASVLLLLLGIMMLISARRLGKMPDADHIASYSANPAAYLAIARAFLDAPPEQTQR